MSITSPRAWLVSIVALAAIACGGSSPSEPGPPPPPPPPPPAPGPIQVSTATSGVDLDPDGYSVSVDGGSAQTIGVNASLMISSLAAGSHSVMLGGLAANCSVAGANPRTATVAVGAAVQVAFGVTCAAMAQNLTGRIVFESNRSGDFEIWVMNADGSNPVNLTNSPGLDYEPAWSPDGSKIAFVSERDGNPEIYVMNATVGVPTRLSVHPGGDFNPAWSPDGARIAFETDRDGPVNYEVYVMNANGTGVTNLTKSPADDYHRRGLRTGPGSRSNRTGTRPRASTCS